MAHVPSRLEPSGLYRSDGKRPDGVSIVPWKCKLVHLAHTTCPLHTIKAFELFDDDVCKCIAQCTAVDTSDHAWHQARLSQSRGGLGLHSLAQHSPAAYIASLCAYGVGSQLQYHFASAIV